ncbi:TonB-dependent siderophore receptor [Paraglaciecola sp.]|uniref:TonB-dependent receptor plug domain-containing protein n=1 Tax=Paraglaciecola sp. TaxID=1920173 RepID=UPI00273E3BDB|nr:TonB-dependent receptor [Paraglaciecola sp.]MDP5029173.1 TonB-dependent receptor plug domain-containing protein [Paraglaciecola sp.]
MKFTGFAHFNPSNSPVLSPIALALMVFYCSSVFADDETDIIEVHGNHLNTNHYLGSVDALLKEQGVDFSAAGGMSSLPILNGMMGDRVKVVVDGADITAACANHMNPPLSYISANQVHALEVVAGISPVSAGGDNIAGVIHVNSINPQYNDDETLAWRSAYVSAQYRSNNQGKSIGVGTSFANTWLSLEYQGAFDDANSYQDGQGQQVLDTLYRAQNHSLSAAVRDDTQQLAIKLMHQSIPFQGFPNQYMDMTDNNSVGLTAQYQRQLAQGEFEAQLNWHHVKHEMGFFSAEKTGMMPMNTDAKDLSYQLQWGVDLNAKQRLIVGHAFYDYQIDDWWPAVEGSMMMGPNDYININAGQRRRITAFAEFEQQLQANWQLSSGIRLEHVSTNTGDVAAYSDGMSMGGMGSMMDVNASAAMAFNALDRKQSDTLVDISILSRYSISPHESFEFGLARKNRAPNLYERYSWGRSTMATTMIGWFGDGNGYVGRIDLQPETAHTASVRFAKSAQNDEWKFSAKLWYTNVSDYVDVELIGSFNNGASELTKRNILQFSNVDATLYGARFEGGYQLVNNASMGRIGLNATLTTTDGERDGSNEPLYQIKPLQTELSLQQELGDWQHALVWQWVAEKDSVDESRLENPTDSYHLINFTSQIEVASVRLTFAITNVFDEYYHMPLGGVSVAEYKRDTTQGFQQLVGEGRSFNFGLNYQF